MTLSRFNMTIEDGILIHLLQFSNYGDEFEVPYFVSQPGIADSLKIRRSHVSYVLKSMKEKELVIERIAHVKDIVRKRKAYFLTTKGQESAVKIKEIVNNKEIEIVTSNGELVTVKIQDFNNRYKTKISLLKLINLIPDDGDFKISEIDNEKGTGNIEKDIVYTHSTQTNFIENMARPIRFIGRKMELDSINGWLEDKLPKVIVVKGIPGIGKTTLISRIIEEYERDVRSKLFWFRCHEWDTIRGILTDIAQFISLFGKDKLKGYLSSQSEIELKEIMKLLETDLPDLNAILVFDDFQKVNEDVLHLFQMFIELLEISKVEKIKLIVLTRGSAGFYDRRDVAIKKLVKEFELTGLCSKDCKELLILKNLEPDQFNKLFKITSGHPLTLELINIYFSEKTKSMVDISEEAISAFGINFDIGEIFQEQHDITRYLHDEIFSELTPSEKKLLKMMAVYRYPVTPDAFFVDDDINYECIDNLVNRSIMHETLSGFDTHELIKEYFYRHMTPQQRINFHGYAAEYYTTQLSGGNIETNKIEQTDRMGKAGFELKETAYLTIEAQHHYLNSNESAKAAELTVKYGDILIGKGYLDELKNIIDNLTLTHENITNEILSELLIHKGHILTLSGNWDEALNCYEESLTLSQGLKDNCGIARGYNAIGVIYYRKGDWKKAMEYYFTGLEFAEKDEDIKNCAKLQSNMALIYWGNGELDKAIEYIQKSLELSEKLEDKHGIARAYNNLGIIKWEQKNLNEAKDAYDKSLKLSEKLGDKRTMAILFDNIGEIYRVKGKVTKAELYYLKSLALSETLGFKWQIAEVNCNLGIMYKEIDKNKSLEHLNKSLDIYKELGAKREVEKVEVLIASD